MNALETCCSTDETRPELMAPMGVEMDGQWWRVATNGLVFAALRDESVERTARGEPRSALGRYMARAAAAPPFATVLVSTLVDCHTPLEHSCRECAECEGYGWDECGLCGAGTACKYCDGGTIGEAACLACKRGRYDYARLGPCVVDASRVREVALTCPTAEVELGSLESVGITGGPALALRSDGWLALVMNLRAGGAGWSSAPRDILDEPVGAVADGARV